MSKSVRLCRHKVNAKFCFVCERDRKRAEALQAEKERKQKEWEAAHPEHAKRKVVRKVLGIDHG